MNTAATAAEEIAKRLEAVRQGTQEAVGRGIEAVHSALEKLKSRLGEVEQAVGKANQTVSDATAKMAEAYKGLTSIVEANLLRQIEAVKARYQQEQSALETSKQFEAALITKSTQLLTEALTQQTTITNVEGMIKALDRIQTESRHQVSTNADAARAEIMSLNGANTSSTHTIYVRKVEANATGGLVGGGVRHFADGGAVAPAFPRMSGGSVPGSGHHDTVPRTLDAGAFVIRKVAVQKYGGGALSRLANRAMGGVAHFAKGGPVTVTQPKRNRDVVEAEKMIELGLQGLGQISYSGSLDARDKTFAYWNPLARQDRSALEKIIDRKTLTANERANLDQIKQRWRFAMAQPMIYGKDLERDLIDYMESLDGEFFAKGGLSKSDTVPAMLTPGEYVVNRSAVARLGVGFFEAINNLSAPAQALAGRALAGIQGFATGGLVQPVGSSLPRPSLPEGTPTRTVRVELSSGQQKVNATVDARDEARLLRLLDAARARTA